MSYIIINTSSEFETLLVATPWNDEDISLARERFKVIQEARDKIVGLRSMSFHAELSVAESGIWFDEYLDENDLREKYEIDYWIVVPELPDQLKRDTLRVDWERTEIDDYGSMTFRFTIKHTDIIYETSHIRIDKL